MTGASSVEDVKHQVYVYDINTDQWGRLPPSGHYYGIPHIIGGKLVIISGCLAATEKITNKVSKLAIVHLTILACSQLEVNLG